MKRLAKISIVLALAGALLLPTFGLHKEEADAEEITTTATGYTKASDVQYVTSGGYVVNWGARGEDCTFLSSKAETFYAQKATYSYDTLSGKKGGSTQGNAHTSELYKALQSMMKAEHDYQTSYGETREQYRYTDCVSNNYSSISSFYSGRVLNGEWDGGSTWNREHTWPNSKGLGGNDENDIMMLRPTWVSENSSRGNTAYGESGSYYDPGESTRGDCARIVLYVYTRWGNTEYMWGTKGVMENMDVLLRWMEEDPVDTWEMGRNDAVQSITGTRNVFVDYPEYAWQLFGKTAPKNTSTPSGEAMGGGGATLPPTSEDTPNSSEEKPDSSVDKPNSSEEAPNSSIEKPTTSVGGSASSGSASNGGGTSSGGASSGGTSGVGTSADDECPNGGVHEYGDWFVINNATATSEGWRERFCIHCSAMQGETIPIPKVESVIVDPPEPTCPDGSAHEYGEWFEISSATATSEGRRERFCKGCSAMQAEIFPPIADVSVSDSASEGDNAASSADDGGCSGSVYGVAGGVILAIACAVVYKRRRVE